MIFQISCRETYVVVTSLDFHGILKYHLVRHEIHQQYRGLWNLWNMCSCTSVTSQNIHVWNCWLNVWTCWLFDRVFSVKVPRKSCCVAYPCRIYPHMVCSEIAWSFHDITMSLQNLWNYYHAHSQSSITTIAYSTMHTLPGCLPKEVRCQHGFHWS